MNSVEELLYQEGPCLSSELTRKIIDRYNISEEAARKRVSRGCLKLRKLPYINFPKNAKFIYLESDFGSPQYWDSLEKVLGKSNSCYSMAYNAIKSRGGVISESSFDTVCGSPIKQKKHIPSKTVLDNLLKSKILFKHDINGIGNCIVTGELNRDKAQWRLKEISFKLVSRLAVENTVVIPLISRWMINTGFTSKNSVRSRSGGDSPKVLNYQWDITASSYLSVLSNYAGAKVSPGFIACDILIDEDVDAEVISTYLKKIKNCSSASSSTTVLYIFVAKSFNYDALLLARRSSDVLAISLNDMLGRRVSEGVLKLTHTLESSLARSMTSKGLKKILKSFEGFQGVYGNVRGLLFEFLCCDILRNSSNYEVERSKTIVTERKDKLGNVTKVRSEIDIYARRNYERRYVECKGWKSKSTLDDKDVERWLDIRIPNTYNSLKEESINFSKIKVTMELWVTCKLTPKAEALIKAKNAHYKKFEIVVQDAKKILDMANKNCDSELTKAYQTIFIDKKDRFSITTPTVDLSDYDHEIDDIPF